MLFISPHPLYQLLGITQEIVNYHPTNGRVLGTTPGIDAEFFHGGAPSWALEQAMANETFRGAWGGLPDGVNLGAYVSSFDTDLAAERLNWDDETKKFVEDFMLGYQDYGQRYFVAVPPQEVADLPWASYNDHNKTHHRRIVPIAREIGVPLQKVLDYETRNKNRPMVVAALEEALQESPEAVEEFVAA